MVHDDIRVPYILLFKNITLKYGILKSFNTFNFLFYVTVIHRPIVGFNILHALMIKYPFISIFFFFFNKENKSTSTLKQKSSCWEFNTWSTWMK